ncbi:hypothetical protein [Streptomyces sp. NPDC085937]|uniref:hypothetical protein n=1 Tax=Streptomyces sp. NPDC085937 TaxID=3365742 RepID=UPI0037D87FA7
MDTTTSPYLAAADRAHVIAQIARDRFASHGIVRVLHDIARHLDAAADMLAKFQPSTIPGIAGHEAPMDAWEELFIVETLADDRPQTLFPPEITEYVKAPVMGRALPFPEPLNPVSARFAAEETKYRARLEQLHQDTARAADDPAGWLTDVCTVWRDWVSLREVVRVDNARPCNRR